MAKFYKEYEVNCPACNAGQVVKVGIRNGVQRLKCKVCKKKFREGGKVKGKKFDPEQIGGAIRHFYTGLSYTQVAEGMRDLYDIEPSTDTLYNFVEEYTHKATHLLKSLKAQTGDTWVADEMWVDVGGRTMYHWNIMDAKSRFLLATHLHEHRDANGARAVLKKALEVADKPPKQIKTDGLTSYARPIRELLPDTKHTITKGVNHFINNNLSERLQNTYRSRTKTLRGLHSKDTGQRFLEGYGITYNFFRKHKGLKEQRPGDVAKVNAPFREWADVVRSPIEVPKLKRIPTPRARKGMAKKKERKQELRKRHREEIKRKVVQDKTNRRQYRLTPSKLDQTTIAKLKSAKVSPTVQAGHQYKLEPIKEIGLGKSSVPKAVPPKPLPKPEEVVEKGHQFKLEPSKRSGQHKAVAPKPELLKMASTTKKRQQPLIPLNAVPRFMMPRPAGSKRH